MQRLRIALAQIAPRLGDVKRNVEAHLAAIADARRGGADVVAFPELSLTGYLLEDQVPEVALSTEAPEIGRILRASRRIDVVLGFVEEAPGHRFHNAAAYMSRGRVVHVHRKVYLPTYGMFQEGRDFAAGDRVRAFDAPAGRMGVLICEDAWHPLCAWLLTQQGAEILFVPSNGPTRGARPGRGVTSVAVWHDLLRVTAWIQTSFVVHVNRVGCEDGLSFGGGSVVLDPFGRAVAEASTLRPDMTFADLDPEVLRRARTAYPLLRDENLDLAWREIGRVRTARFDLPADAEEEGSLESGAEEPGRLRPRRRTR